MSVRRLVGPSVGLSRGIFKCISCISCVSLSEKIESKIQDFFISWRNELFHFSAKPFWESWANLGTDWDYERNFQVWNLSISLMSTENLNGLSLMVSEIWPSEQAGVRLFPLISLFLSLPPFLSIPLSLSLSHFRRKMTARIMTRS